MKTFALFGRRDQSKVAATNPLESIYIAAPCPASWEKMTGDDRIRHCLECKLNVYNLSEMTRIEAERLIANHAGRMCVRFYRRTDGTILTKDCPRGLQAVIRRVSRLAGTALTVMMSANLSAVQGSPLPRPQTSAQSKQELGELNVTITDPLGAVFAGAQVTLTGANARQIKLLTDSNGRAHFAGLPAGDYAIVVAVRGFNESSRRIEVQQRTPTAMSMVLFFDPNFIADRWEAQPELVPTIDPSPSTELTLYKILPAKKDKKHR